MNRYYKSLTGRFLTADLYMANNGGPGDPSDPGVLESVRVFQERPGKPAGPLGNGGLHRHILRGRNRFK